MCIVCGGNIILDVSQGLWDGAVGSRFGTLAEGGCAMCHGNLRGVDLFLVTL